MFYSTLHCRMDQKDTEIFVDTDGRTYKQFSPEQLKKVEVGDYKESDGLYRSHRIFILFLLIYSQHFRLFRLFCFQIIQLMYFQRRKILYLMLSSFLLFIIVVIMCGVFLACVVGSCFAQTCVLLDNLRLMSVIYINRYYICAFYSCCKKISLKNVITNASNKNKINPRCAQQYKLSRILHPMCLSRTLTIKLLLDFFDTI